LSCAIIYAYEEERPPLGGVLKLELDRHETDMDITAFIILAISLGVVLSLVAGD
jgi:hypothetical protein